MFNAAGSTRPKYTCAPNCVPMIVAPRTAMTIAPSSTSWSEAARYVSADRVPRPIASMTASATVWIAIPPRMFPVAISMLCSIAAVTVIAISGRFVVTASRMAPASLPEMEAQGEHVGHP
jgi:hypothetical protein